MKGILLILIAVLLGSCATIFNKKTQNISISTNSSKGAVKVNDSIYSLPAKITVKRSKEDLPIEFISDSLNKKYSLKPAVNAKFLYGNLLFLDFFPLGYITDFTNQKRFSYQDQIILNPTDTIVVIKTNRNKKFDTFKHHFIKKYPAKKGQINFMVAIPCINNFYLEPKSESSVHETGFGGISTGVEYFYSNKNYLAARFRAATPFMTPLPLPLESFGEYERMYSLIFDLTNNHKLNRFSVGYGLNYTKNTWIKHFENYESISESSIKKTNKALGLTLNSYYQISSYLFVGLNYNQSLFSVNSSTKNLNEHVISFDFVFKISPNKH